MTLEILEGTFLEQGPEFWAFLVLVALFLIEIFQLGPHSFRPSSKKKKDDFVPSRKIPKGVGRATHGSNSVKSSFRNTIINSHFHFGKNAAVLFIVTGQNYSFQPDLPSTIPEGTKETMIYPQVTLADNYILCSGEEPIETSMKQLGRLWDAQDRSEAKDIVLYSRQIPSTYMVQRISTVLKKYTKLVCVSVFYLEEYDEEDSVDQKVEHLRKFDITLERLTFP